MVKVNGPMFSLAASGTLGEAITFAQWKGRAYVRECVKPANPKSIKQLSVRAMMKALSQIWDPMGLMAQWCWYDLAAQDNISPFNAFIKFNLRRWRSFRGPSMLDTAPEGGTPPTNGVAAAVGGVRMATVTMPVTAALDGWFLLIFRKLDGAVTPAFDNLVKLIRYDGTNDLVFVDTPLEPGTWHYDFYSDTDEGLLTDETDPVSCVVTA